MEIKSIDDLIRELKSESADRRSTAAELAGPFGANAVTPIAELITGDHPPISKAAGEALKTVVTHSGRNGASSEARAVCAQLINLTVKSKPRNLRLDAIRYLGWIGGEAETKALAGLILDPETRDEARMALERIPGKAAESALKEAARAVPTDFRFAIDQSLSHRKVPRAKLGIRRS